MDASSRLLKTCEETRALIAEALKRRLPLKRQVEGTNTFESTHPSKRVRSVATTEYDYPVSRDISATTATTTVPDAVLDREAFRKRLESFTDSFITHSRPINAVQCAMHGFIDTHILEGPKQDICKLACEVCESTNYVIDLTDLTANSHRLKSIHEKYTAGLELFHKESCVWRKHQCPPQIYSFPRITHHEAIEKIRKEGKELLQYGEGLPTIVHPLSPEQLKKVEYFIRDAENPAGRYEFSPTPLTPLPQAVWTSYILPLFGWQLLDNGALKCSCCFRQIRSGHFDDPDHKRFDIIKEHRDYCPWINSSSAQVAPPRPSPFVKSVCGYEWMVATIELEYEILLKLKDESPVYQSSRTQWLNAEKQRVKRARMMLSQVFPDSSRTTPDNKVSGSDLVPTISQEPVQAETYTTVSMEQQQHQEEQQADTSFAMPNIEVDGGETVEPAIAVPSLAKHDVGDLMTTDAAQEVSQPAISAVRDGPVSVSAQDSGIESQNHFDELSDNNEKSPATELGDVSEEKADTRIMDVSTHKDVNTLIENEAADTLPKNLAVTASPLPKHLEGDLGDLLDSEAEVEAEVEDSEKKEPLALDITGEVVEATEDELGEEFDESILDEVDKMEDLETPAGEQHDDRDDELYLEAAEADTKQTEDMEMDDESQKHMTSGKTPASALTDMDDEMEDLSKSPAANDADDKEELLVQEIAAESAKDELGENVEKTSSTVDSDNTDTQTSAPVDVQILETEITEETEIEIVPQSPVPAADHADETTQAIPLDDTQMPQSEVGELGVDVQSQSIVTEVETPLNAGTPDVEANLDDVDQIVDVEVEEVKVQESAPRTAEDPEKNEEDRDKSMPTAGAADIDEAADEEMELIEKDNIDIDEQQEPSEVNEASVEDKDPEKTKAQEAFTADSNLSIHGMDSPMEEANIPKEDHTNVDEIQPELDLGEDSNEATRSPAPIPEADEDKAVDEIVEKEQELEDAAFIPNLANDDYLGDDNAEEKQDAVDLLEGEQLVDGAADEQEIIEQDVSGLDQGKKATSPGIVGDDIYGEEGEGAQNTTRHHEEHQDEDKCTPSSADAEVVYVHESFSGQEGERLDKINQDLSSRREINEEEEMGGETTLEDEPDALLPPDIDEAAEDPSSDHENYNDDNEDTRETSRDGGELVEQAAPTDSAKKTKDLQEDV